MFRQSRTIHVITLEFSENELKDLIHKLDSTDANAHSIALAHFTKLGGFAKLFYTVCETSKLPETKEQAFRDLLKRVFESFGSLNEVNSGKTCLMYAITKISSIGVDRMIAMGAAVNFRTEDRVSAIDAYAGTIYSPQKRSYSACKKELSVILKNLIQHGADVNQPGPGGTYPIMNAIGLQCLLGENNSDLRQFDELLNLPNIDLTVHNKANGSTVVSTAAQFGKVSDLEKLLARGASIKAATPLHAPPLFTAIVDLKWDHARSLLNHNADPNELLNTEHDMTPLYCAVIQYQQNSSQKNKALILEIIRLLLIKRANPYIICEKSYSSISFAVASNQIALLECFAAAGVDFSRACHPNQMTPMMLAVLFGYTDVIAFLVRHGVSLFDLTEDKRSVLHYACLGRQHSLVRQYLPAMRHLIDAVDSFGLTPLYLASSTGCLDAVQFLLSNGANARFEGPNKQTPLFIAAVNDHADVVETLARHANNVNARLTDGTTALMAAAQDGCMGAVRKLIELGADVTIKNANDISCLYLALMNEHEKVAAIIRSQHDEIESVLAFLCHATGQRIPAIDDPDSPAYISIRGKIFPRQLQTSTATPAVTETPAREMKYDDFTDSDVVSGFQYLKNMGLNPDDFTFDKNTLPLAETSSKPATPTQAFTWFNGQLESQMTDVNAIESKYGSKNCYLYIDEASLIDQGCSSEMLDRVRNMRYKFAASEGEIGIVKLHSKISLAVSYADNNEDVSLSDEIKLLNSPERILCYRKSSDDNKSILFVACIYASNGLHQTSDSTRLKTKISLNLPEIQQARRFKL